MEGNPPMLLPESNPSRQGLQLGRTRFSIRSSAEHQPAAGRWTEHEATRLDQDPTTGPAHAGLVRQWPPHASKPRSRESDTRPRSRTARFEVLSLERAPAT